MEIKEGVKMTIKELNLYCKNKGKTIVVHKGKLVGFKAELWV